MTCNLLKLTSFHFITNDQLYTQDRSNIGGSNTDRNNIEL